MWLLKQDQIQVASNSLGKALGSLNAILTVFDGGLGLFSIVEKGITWERKGKRDSQTIPCSPGGCPDKKGSFWRKGSNSPLGGVGLSEGNLDTIWPL